MSIFKSLAKKLLREAEEVEETPGEDSLDSQVDKYLVDYEKEAKNSKNEGLNFRNLSRRFLTEADEDEEDEKEGEEEPEEEEEAGDDEEKKLTEEDIDVSSFATSVMRLIDNYDSLLEVRNTILRRASNFLAKNYNKEAVDLFNEELLETHGVEIGKTDAEKQDDEFELPAADRAGASPSGGG
jgi:hypothetical protein